MNCLKRAIANILILTTIFMVSFPCNALEIKSDDLMYNASNVFAERFCTATENGISTETAMKVASRKTISSFIFSPNLKDILDIPKDELVTNISKTILEKCKDEKRFSKAELEVHLIELAINLP